jgi:2-keto-3-deoxy-L-rhamnonate aldolase RhmA
VDIHPSPEFSDTMYQTMHKFREKLDSGHLCLGSGITLSDIAVTEALGPSVDFFWIDTEHSPIGYEALAAHLVAARATGTPALVRTPSSEKSLVKRVLDIGAPGVIVPQVESADEVRQFVRECRYPPEGLRGFGPRRPSNYGREGGRQFLDEANRGVFVVAQIERMAAVRQLDEILAIPGLDSIVLGGNDLAHDMGHAGDESNVEVRKTIEDVVARGRKAGLYVGMGMDEDPEQIVWAAGIGIQWIQPGGDFSYMVSGCDRLYSSVREALGRG